MWYVMQVCTGQEMEIARQCRSFVAMDDEDVFVPLTERQTKVHGKWTLVKVRLFPGYVFIDTAQIADFFLRLRKIKARAKVLDVDGVLTAISREEEDYLSKLCGAEHVARYSEGYVEGDILVVSSGALKGCEAKVKKILRHKRLAVLEMKLLGRSVEVTLGLGVVEKRAAADGN